MRVLTQRPRDEPLTRSAAVLLAPVCVFCQVW